MNSRQQQSLRISLWSALICALAMVVFCKPAVAQSSQAAGAGLQAQAEGGDAGAQYRLGKFILAHNPSPDDVQAGLKWLQAAAGQNNPNAEFYLGYLYEHGQFVAQNYALALQNYEAATRVHYPPAENNLGSLYQHGQGVPKNIGKALEWYLAAAQHGNAIGQMNLANLYCGGDGAARDYQKAVYWLRLAADTGLPDAQNNLAYFYFYGITLPQDYVEAARLVQLAAQQNLPSALTSMGYLYETGKGVRLDYVAAYNSYTRAMAGGDHTGAGHRKQLEHVMTRKQLDEANALSAASTPLSATPELANSWVQAECTAKGIFPAGALIGGQGAQHAAPLRRMWMLVGFEIEEGFIAKGAMENRASLRGLRSE